jgi:hypothetical protein
MRTVVNTSGQGVRLRNSPTFGDVYSPTTSIPEGVQFQLLCQTWGEAVNTNSIWGQVRYNGITAYVPDTYMDTPNPPNQYWDLIPKCNGSIAPPPPGGAISHVTNTGGSGVRLRSTPVFADIYSPTTYIPDGVGLELLCQTPGEAVNTNTTWGKVKYNRIIAYVPDTYMDTPNPPSQFWSAVPRCENVCAIPTGNLLTNASFENGFEPWTGFVNGPIAGYTTYGSEVAVPQQGSRFGAAHVNSGQVGRSFFQDSYYCYGPGETFSYSMWLRSSSNQPYSATLATWGHAGSNRVGHGETAVTLTSTWQLVNTSMITSGYGNSIRTELYFGTTDVDVYFDNATLVRGPGPTARAPGPPIALSGSVANGSISLSWLRPTDDGGSPVRSYRATLEPSGRVIPTASLAATFAGVVNGTAYTVRVQAVNDAGVGEAVALNSLVPVAPVVPPAKPVTPSLTVSPGSVAATWQHPSTDGGSAVIDYVATLIPTGRQTTTTGRTATFSGVAAGDYAVSVVARNAAGASGPAVSAGATVPGPPLNPTGVSFVPLVPGRFVDTRSSGATVDAKFDVVGERGAGSVTELQVGGRVGVPGDAAAVVLTVTVTGARDAGFVTVWPCGVARPNASNLNFAAGATIANTAITKLGLNGKVCVYTSAATHLIADITGQYPADA